MAASGNPVALQERRSRRPARRRMLSRKHAAGRFHRMEGLSRRSRMTKNMKRNRSSPRPSGRCQCQNRIRLAIHPSRSGRRLGAVFHRASPCRRAERVRGIKQAGHAAELDPIPGVGNEKPVSHRAYAREAAALQRFMERNDHSNCSSRSVRSGSAKEKLPRLSARQSASSAKTAIIHPVFAWHRSCQ